MLSAPPLDPTGAMVEEARADAHVAALVGVDTSGRVRVYGYEAAPGVAQGAPNFKPHVVIVSLDVAPHQFVPLLQGTYAIRCYGTTGQNAMAVYLAMVKAFHKRKLRERVSNHQWIWISSVESGGEQDKDPDTKQPVVYGAIRIIATAEAVT